MLVGHSQQQPSIQEAYHHKPFAGAKRQLSLHNQSALGQRPRTRQKIELAETPGQPHGKAQHGNKQKKNAHGLHIAAPTERGLAEAGDVAARNGLIRGMIRDGFAVNEGFKIADIDPRKEELANCFTISDKARCIAGSVLEAIMDWENKRPRRRFFHRD